MNMENIIRNYTPICIDLLMAFSIIGLIYLVRKYLANMVVRFILKKPISFTDETTRNNIIKSVGNIFVAIGLFVAINFINFKGQAELLVSNIVLSLIIANITHACILINSSMLKVVKNKIPFVIKEWINYIMTLIILCISITSILNLWGINIASIIAGVGIFGAGLSFAAKDFLENIIAGITILTEERFKVGDAISIDGVCSGGHVINIRIRSTEIQLFNGSVMYIPNTKIVSNSILNYSEVQLIRIEIFVGIDYSTPLTVIEKICEDVMDFIKLSELFNKENLPRSFCRIFELANSAINLKIHCFTNNGSSTEAIITKETLLCKVMEIIRNNGSSIPFPTQSIYIENTKN